MSAQREQGSGYDDAKRDPEAISADRRERRPMSLPRLAEMKLNAEPIVMVTAYDHPSAEIAEAAGVDLVLVGDTAAMTVLGHSSTNPVSLDEMLVLAKAVRRGLRTPLLVGDLPFGSYEASDELAVATATRYVKEAGCDVVKLERGGVSADRARAIVRAGIPVMGHVGLTPQTATALGGFRAQGRTLDQAARLADEARALQQAGCFSIVFEAVPGPVSELLAPRLNIPVIGIGAGVATDGQVLVWHDLLGISGGHQAKFVKRYAELRAEMTRAVGEYASEVRGREFPGPEHTYSIDPEELEAFRGYLESAAAPSFDGDWSATEI